MPNLEHCVNEINKLIANKSKSNLKINVDKDSHSECEKPTDKKKKKVSFCEDCNIMEYYEYSDDDENKELTEKEILRIEYMNEIMKELHNNNDEITEKVMKDSENWKILLTDNADNNKSFEKQSSALDFSRSAGIWKPKIKVKKRISSWKTLYANYKYKLDLIDAVNKIPNQKTDCGEIDMDETESVESQLELEATNVILPYKIFRSLLIYADNANIQNIHHIKDDINLTKELPEKTDDCNFSNKSIKMKSAKFKYFSGSSGSGNLELKDKFNIDSKTAAKKMRIKSSSTTTSSSSSKSLSSSSSSILENKSKNVPQPSNTKKSNSLIPPSSLKSKNLEQEGNRDFSVTQKSQMVTPQITMNDETENLLSDYSQPSSRIIPESLASIPNNQKNLLDSVEMKSQTSFNDINLRNSSLKGNTCSVMFGDELARYRATQKLLARNFQPRSISSSTESLDIDDAFFRSPCRRNSKNKLNNLAASQYLDVSGHSYGHVPTATLSDLSISDMDGNKKISLFSDDEVTACPSPTNMKKRISIPRLLKKHELKQRPERNIERTYSYDLYIQKPHTQFLLMKLLRPYRTAKYLHNAFNHYVAHYQKHKMEDLDFSDFFRFLESKRILTRLLDRRIFCLERSLGIEIDIHEEKLFLYSGSECYKLTIYGPSFEKIACGLKSLDEFSPENMFFIMTNRFPTNCATQYFCKDGRMSCSNDKRVRPFVCSLITALGPDKTLIGDLRGKQFLQWIMNVEFHKYFLTTQQQSEKRLLQK